MAQKNQKVIPCLEMAMRQAEATTAALSTTSGVTFTTIRKAERGMTIRTALADVIMESLCKDKFTFNKQIPHFDKAMRIAEATNISLGIEAGIDVGTIQRARNGCKVRPHTADTLMQTLCTRIFVYLKPGRRPQGE